MLTSEQQKIYNVKVPKGGYGYYTLYHGIYDPTNNIDERPVYAQTGDLFEPEGSSVVYKATRKNGKTTWAIAEDAQRQSESGESGSGGGSLPADFPAEGSANANKFLGFDANGDYTAKDAPSGGGAEKFVVTLTEDDSGAETVWTADKTLAEIYEAKQNGDVVVCNVTYGYVPYEFPAVSVVDMGSVDDHAYICIFEGTSFGEAAESLIFIGEVDKNSDIWALSNNPLSKELPTYSSSNNGQVLGVSSGEPAWVDSNAPLIVTLTVDESTGNFVGDKTYKEVYDAVYGGQTVTFKSSFSGLTVATNALSVGLANGGYSVALVFGGSIVEAEGAENDYVSIHIN